MFYLLSRYLNKRDFGELNWSIASLSVATTILSLGTDYLIVKKIASGNDARKIGGLHLTHTLATCVLFFILLLGCSWIWPDFYKQHNLLLALSISLLLTFLASPFKQVANGRESFRNYAIMMIAGNVGKGVLLLAAVLLGMFSIQVVVTIYIAASVVEWLIGAILVIGSIGRPLRPFWDKAVYWSLIRESFPQLGVLLFDSALARIDWILLGLIKGPAATAEYSFPYKVYEVSRLPMLIIAPIILPKFIRYLNSSEAVLKEKKDEMSLLLKFETNISMLIPLFFNLTWTPLMGWLTAGKYGAVDAPIYMLLSICVPLQYFINFLWTIAFAQKQLKLTFYISALTSLLNFGLNLALIPRWGTQGAAISFVISTLVQFLCYKIFTDQRRLSVPILPLFASAAIAAGCIFLSRTVTGNPVLGVLIGGGCYLFLIFVFRLLHLKDLQRLKIILLS